MAVGELADKRMAE